MKAPRSQAAAAAAAARGATPSVTEPSRPRNAIVIGAGIAGVCTAHQLARKGVNVTILDASSGFGAECSRAAAGGMQRVNGTVDANQWRATMRAFAKLAVPSFLRPESFFPWFSLGSEAVTDMHFWRWMKDFSAASLFADAKAQEYKAKHMLRFTCWAISAMEETMSAAQYGSKNLGAVSDKRIGALKLICSHGELERLKATPQNRRWGFGAETSQFLSKEEVEKMEPWLRNSKKFGNGSLCGALYQPNALQANCEWYTQALGKVCTDTLGVQTQFRTKITGFSVENAPDQRRISQIFTEDGNAIGVNKDTAVVFACGSWTPKLLRSLQLYCPIYPLKGYNILVDLTENDVKESDVPSRIVSDSIFYVTRYHDQVRLTSMGEFSGWGTTPTPVVEGRMRSEAKKWFPELGNVLDKSEIICGLRPLTADGMLLLGELPGFSNAFINAGPGSNGWKVGIGAAEVLARIICPPKNLTATTNSALDTIGPSSEAFTYEQEEIPFDQNIFSLFGRVQDL